MSTRYTPTSLPVKLDLSRGVTSNQLRKGDARVSSPKPQTISNTSKLQEEMNKMCIDVVTSSLDLFLKGDILLDGGYSSDEQFERWMRHFHSEYDEVWFANNHTRLYKSFRPIWNQHLGIDTGSSSTSSQFQTHAGSVGLVSDLLELDKPLKSSHQSSDLPDLLG